MVARRRLREKRARRVRVVTVRWGSRKGGAKFGETFEGGEPGAALVPVAGGEGHLRGLRGGEIRHGECRGQVFELGDDGRGHVAGVESPEEETEPF